MRVYIEGLYVPNTNEWWVGSEWTFGDLKADVVKIVTAKTGDPSQFRITQKDGTEVDETASVSTILSEGDSVRVEHLL